MHQVVAEARLAALEQARQQIGIPAGMAHEAPAIVGQARHKIGIRMPVRRARWLQSRRAVPASRARRHPATTPNLLSRNPARDSSARRSPASRAHEHVHRVACDRHRVVRAAGIHHDDLVRPRHRFQTGADIRRFVLGDNDDGQTMHATYPVAAPQTTLQS